jgi:hypothetical protein
MNVVQNSYDIVAIEHLPLAKRVYLLLDRIPFRGKSRPPGQGDRRISITLEDERQRALRPFKADFLLHIPAQFRKANQAVVVGIRLPVTNALDNMFGKQTILV